MLMKLYIYRERGLSVIVTLHLVTDIIHYGQRMYYQFVSFHKTNLISSLDTDACVISVLSKLIDRNIYDFQISLACS